MTKFNSKKMKKLRSVGIAMAFVLSLTACAKDKAEESGQASLSESASQSGADRAADASTGSPSASESAQADALPGEMDIAITREGETEFFVGTLQISESFGYAVYVLPDFEFHQANAAGPSDGIDSPSAHTDSEAPSYRLQIAQVDPSKVGPPYEGAPEDGFKRRFEYVTVDDKALELQFIYPEEAEEGGLVLLRAMVDTMRSAKTGELAKPALSGSVDNLGSGNPGSGTFAFSDLAGMAFTFSSGAGGWQTQVEIQPDGTFTGQHIDSDMGAQGIGNKYPNGTIYLSNFSGKFAPPEPASDYVYQLKCESFTQEGTLGTEKIIDGVRYINASPYGFENILADAPYQLFVPETPFEELPEAILQWEGRKWDEGEQLVIGTYKLFSPLDESVFDGAAKDGSDSRIDVEWD